MHRGVKLISSTVTHHTISLVNIRKVIVNIIPYKFNLKWEIESLKQRKEGCQKTNLRLPANTPARFIYSTYGAHSYKYLLTWENYTKVDLNLIWLNWVSFDIPKFIFLHTPLEKAGCKIKQTEWNVYFDWYLGASKRGNARATSLQENNKKLIETISELEKVTSTDSVSPSAAPTYPLLSELPGPYAISFSLPILPPPAVLPSPAKEDKKSEMNIAPFKEEPITVRGEPSLVLTCTLDLSRT